MHLQITLINTFLFASLAYASDAKPGTPAEHATATTIVTFPASDNMVLETGTDYFVPDFMLDEDIALTPEESQLRSVNLGKLFARLSKSAPGSIRKLSPFKFQETGTPMTSMLPETDYQETDIPVTSDSVIAPNVDNEAGEEENKDLDTAEETELRRGWRSGRGGRGGCGRGGRGRFGRGRFGRGGRFGRFGGRRFGRFGGWGSRWNDDCGGDDCGDC